MVQFPPGATDISLLQSLDWPMCPFMCSVSAHARSVNSCPETCGHNADYIYIYIKIKYRNYENRMHIFYVINTIFRAIFIVCGWIEN